MIDWGAARRLLCVMSAVLRWAGQGVTRCLPGAFCPCTGVPGRVTGRWPPQGGPGKRARAAEWDTLLMCCARKGTEGSNPSASALAPGSSGRSGTARPPRWPECTIAR